jgi:hypothetical protein
LGTFWLSSNGQNCSILSQKVPKFELYQHNDELLNIYYGFFMNFELLTILTDYANAHYYAYTVQIWALSGLK